MPGTVEKTTLEHEPGRAPRPGRGSRVARRVMHQLRHWGRELLSYVTDTLSVRHRKAVRDERAKLDEIAAVLFEGYPPPEEHLVVAASLHRTFPTVPPERLKEAADVVVEAMAIPDGEARLAGLDQAGIKVADIFTAK